jgi:hypothetical protein
VFQSGRRVNPLIALWVAGGLWLTASCANAASQRLPEAAQDPDVERLIVDLRPGAAPSFSPLMPPDPAAIGSAQRELRDRLERLSDVTQVESFRGFPGLGVEFKPAARNAVLAQLHGARVWSEEWLTLGSSSWLEVVEASSAWAVGATGEGQRVAVLDTGFDLQHEALQGRFVQEACFSRPGRGSTCPGRSDHVVGPGAADLLPTDDWGAAHGTQVASVIVRASPATKLIGVQVATRQRGFPHCLPGQSCLVVSTWDLARALGWLLELSEHEPLAAINISLSGELFEGACADHWLAPQVEALRRRGVATVAAAGNDAQDAISVPACLPQAISVGASDGDQLASFSNRHRAISVIAPGVAIATATPGGREVTASGTSLAAPIVSGAIAAIKSVEPDLPVADLVARLASRAERVALGEDDWLPQLQFHGLSQPHEVVFRDGGFDRGEEHWQVVAGDPLTTPGEARIAPGSVLEQKLSLPAGHHWSLHYTVRGANRSGACEASRARIELISAGEVQTVAEHDSCGAQPHAAEVSFEAWAGQTLRLRLAGFAASADAAGEVIFDQLEFRESSAPEQLIAPLVQVATRAQAGSDVMITARDASSSWEQPLEQMVRYGDGSFSEWQPASASLFSTRFDSAGRFLIAARARDASNPTVVSEWSAERAIAVDPSDLPKIRIGLTAARQRCETGLGGNVRCRFGLHFELINDDQQSARDWKISALAFSTQAPVEKLTGQTQRRRQGASLAAGETQRVRLNFVSVSPAGTWPAVQVVVVAQARSESGTLTTTRLQVGPLPE